MGSHETLDSSSVAVRPAVRGAENPAVGYVLQPSEHCRLFFCEIMETLSSVQRSAVAR